MQERQGTPRGSVPLAKRYKVKRRLVLLLVIVCSGYGLYAVSRIAYTIFVTNNPTNLTASEDMVTDDLESRRNAILTQLNEEISRDKKQSITERVKILAAIRSFFLSLRSKHRTHHEVDQPTAQQIAVSKEDDGPSDRDQTSRPIPKEHLKPVLTNSRTTAFNEYAAPSTPAPTFSANIRSSFGHTDIHYDLPVVLHPLDGVNTKGIVWKVHRKLILEGMFDASASGPTDRDLQDFGFRSIHAQTLLEHASKPEFLFGRERIESGFPRSFGIGINLEVNPAVNLIFDYVHEFSNEYLMEYTGSWEASLVSDYSKLRPEDQHAMHTFFFGMRYLYRDQSLLMPIHTGFFYTTTTGTEPINSIASLGFSLGTGIRLPRVKLGLAYRMRIWESPDRMMLLEPASEQPRGITNQFLFQAHF